VQDDDLLRLAAHVTRTGVFTSAMVNVTRYVTESGLNDIFHFIHYVRQQGRVATFSVNSEAICLKTV